MRSLKSQLLVSHLALVGLMTIVMIGAVAKFMHLGRSIDGILTANYKSVIAAQNMKETLERQDSAATFYLAGQITKARAQYQDNRPKFQAAYNIEAHNITEVGEQEAADDIGRQFEQYHRAVEALLYADPPMPTDRARAYYFGLLEPSFLRLKARAQDVLDMNQSAILKANRRAKDEARRASVTGIGVSVVSFGLATLFALRMISASLGPLQSLARQAEEIGAGHWNHRIELRRNDEIGAVATAFNRMAEKLRRAWRLEEQRLHRAERMSDAALENLYDPVIVTDATGKIAHLNRAAEGLFGPAETVTGMQASRVVANPRIADGIERAIQQMRISAHDDDAGLVQLQQGDVTRIYRLRVSPMNDDIDGLLGAVAVLEDVTHLKELDRLKTEFVGVASHELRTPVTSLLLSVQLLLEGAVGELSPEQLEVINAQRMDLDRLERMMRDLLDITRLEAGVTPPRFEIVPESELISGAIRDVATMANAGGIRIEKVLEDPDPLVRADRAQLGRVLVNLLNNSIRHTPIGGLITLTSSTTDDSAEIIVDDNGTGIPDEYLPKIFDRFVQVPGATRGGSGLGLSIARTIITAHGGEIWAEHHDGPGTRIVIKLPTVKLHGSALLENSGKS